MGTLKASRVTPSRTGPLRAAFRPPDQTSPISGAPFAAPIPLVSEVPSLAPDPSEKPQAPSPAHSIHIVNPDLIRVHPLSQMACAAGVAPPPGCLAVQNPGFRKYDSAVAFEIRQSWRILVGDGSRREEVGKETLSHVHASRER